LHKKSDFPPEAAFFMQNTEGYFLDLKLPSPYFHDIAKKIILRIFVDKFADKNYFADICG
jgi:hypothetical protein